MGFDDNHGLTQKCLPITYPLITSYTQHAHLLSILSEYELAHPWIFSNYIQLYINKDYEHNWGDFYFPLPYELRPSDTCKWIRSQKILRGIIDEKWGSIINYIIESINLNHYVQTMVNCFYIPLYINYQHDHFRHDIFIYGFDNNEEVLYVSDFFRGGKYSHGKVSFSDFEQAFSSYHLARDTDHLVGDADYLNGMVYSYKFYNGCDYEFDIQNISCAIKAYLSGKIPEYWEMYNQANRANIVFGVKVYQSLKNYLCRKISNGDFNIDILPFHLLYDHKKMMSLRVEFLEKHGFLNPPSEAGPNIFKEIETQAKMVINIIIKSKLSRQNIMKKVSMLLSEIEKKESDALHHLLSLLPKSTENRIGNNHYQEAGQ